MAKAIFITGTGTDVGKTYVTALLVKKLAESGRNAAYYKAAMSGNARRADASLIPGDALAVKTVSGIAQPLEAMCPYVYENAVSPHLAARIEGNPVEMETVRQGFTALCKDYDFITMEGSGGILCPIRRDETRLDLEDVIRALRLPSLIVADAGLGTINAVGLTAFYMREKGLPVKGILFNHWTGDTMQRDNLAMCEALTGLPVLACVADGDTALAMDADALAALYDETEAGK